MHYPFLGNPLLEGFVILIAVWLVGGCLVTYIYGRIRLDKHSSLDRIEGAIFGAAWPIALCVLIVTGLRAVPMILCAPYVWVFERAAKHESTMINKGEISVFKKIWGRVVNKALDGYDAGNSN